MTTATRHKDSTERKAFLKQVLPALTDKDVTELEGISLLVHHEEGDLIAQEGAYASGVFIVQTGLVSIGKYASRGWEKRCLRFLAVGEMFGLEAAFLEREPINVEYAKALVESTLVFFERSNFLAFGKQHPRLFADLCRWLAREVIMLEFKLTREAVESMDRNLALLLIALGNKYGTPRDGGTVLSLVIPRQTMAEMLGVSLETLMRGLKRFRELGLVSTDRGEICIRDLDALVARARVNQFYLSIIQETL